LKGSKRTMTPQMRGGGVSHKNWGKTALRKQNYRLKTPTLGGAKEIIDSALGRGNVETAGKEGRSRKKTVRAGIEFFVKAPAKTCLYPGAQEVNEGQQGCRKQGLRPKMG